MHDHVGAAATERAVAVVVERLHLPVYLYAGIGFITGVAIRLDAEPASTIAITAAGDLSAHVINVARSAGATAQADHYDTITLQARYSDTPRLTFALVRGKVQVRGATVIRRQRLDDRA